MGNMEEITTTIKCSAQYRTGPGRHESLVVTSWKDRHRNQWVRVRGWITVYCGCGNSHDVEVDERGHLADFARSDLYGRYEVTPESACDVAEEWALSDWTDPCDDDEWWDDLDAEEVA